MRWLFVLALSGCSSILGIDDFKLGDAGGGGEGMNPEAGGGYCLGPTGWRVCLMAMPTNPPLDITATLALDTVSSPLCAPTQPASWKAAGQPDACFLIAPSVTFNAPVITARGGRPLVVFASDTITVTTQIDVASHGTAVRGAAAPSSDCLAPGQAGNSTSAAGGGPGGSFMSAGGNGGTSTSGALGGGASAALAQAPTILRAGCSGGRGGDVGANTGGAQGIGGGAIYLVAGTRITINGFINASGGGASGGATNGGGGGGGSGGMIVLHAPAISGNGGVVVANGGGGGGGAGNQPGGAGLDPSTAMPNMVAIGGAPGGPGGVGGSGAAGTINAANGANGAVGGVGAGGGAGGGIGYIRSNVALSQVTASPAATIVP